MEEIISKKIAVVETKSGYPDFPYEDNKFKSDILNLLESIGLDPNNPFGNYLKEGGTVLIKPNWVREHNPKGNFESLVTHTSIIKNIMDLAAAALNGRGRIIIGDAPLQNCNFDKLLDISRIKDVVKIFSDKYPEIEVVIEDWRITTMKSSESRESVVQIQKISENDAKIKDYSLIDLANDSFLEEISNKANLFRVTKYKPSLLKKHHHKGRHEYLVTKRIFEADLIINIPKLKTHIKAGLTGALKNLVGINGHKEFLPHHMKGSAEEGGDNYKHKNYLRSKYEDVYDYLWENFNNISVWKRRFLIRLVRTLEALSIIFGKEGITAGSWPGNDTIWRTTLDLNHILYFEGKPKKILNIVDGIVAGEGNGPLEPEANTLGLMIAGENPALVDAVIAKVIGYNIFNIKTVNNALNNILSKFKIENLNNVVISWISRDKVDQITLESVVSRNFKKPRYWEAE